MDLSQRVYRARFILSVKERRADELNRLQDQYPNMFRLEYLGELNDDEIKWIVEVLKHRLKSGAQ